MRRRRARGTGTARGVVRAGRAVSGTRQPHARDGDHAAAQSVRSDSGPLRIEDRGLAARRRALEPANRDQRSASNRSGAATQPATRQFLDSGGARLPACRPGLQARVCGDPLLADSSTPGLKPWPTPGSAPLTPGRSAPARCAPGRCSTRPASPSCRCRSPTAAG